MANINFIITKPTGYVIGNDKVLSPSTIISQNDTNDLNVSLVGWDGPLYVEMDLTLPDGTKINNLRPSATVSTPKLFTINLSEVFNSISVGVDSTITITEIRINDLGYQYKTSSPYSIRLFRTDANSSFVLSDIDNLYILVNKLQEEINRLKTGR